MVIYWEGSDVLIWLVGCKKKIFIGFFFYFDIGLFGLFCWCYIYKDNVVLFIGVRLVFYWFCVIMN